METDRSDLVQALRDLADLLVRCPVVPTPPHVSVSATMPAGHTFMDLLGLVEALAPCGVEESMVDNKREIVRRLGPVTLYVTVNTGALGEVRPVRRWLPTFFVDSEIIRVGQMDDQCCRAETTPAVGIV